MVERSIFSVACIRGILVFDAPFRALLYIIHRYRFSTESISFAIGRVKLTITLMHMHNVIRVLAGTITCIP